MHTLHKEGGSVNFTAVSILGRGYAWCWGQVTFTADAVVMDEQHLSQPGARQAWPVMLQPLGSSPISPLHGASMFQA